MGFWDRLKLVLDVAAAIVYYETCAGYVERYWVELKGTVEAKGHGMHRQNGSFCEHLLAATWKCFQFHMPRSVLIPFPPLLLLLLL